ncbi:ArsR/SmtB family transcription factor [Ornithinimicrobium sp. W1679]|uniref:ArsR/SmtB family transcription factor n=1 Tax=Ornithinimicrobium sp. W1679 TaxID=3418770 RepID=UPI003CF23B9A
MSTHSASQPDAEDVTDPAARLRDLCCSPVLAGELEGPDAELLARTLRTLGDPVRLRILGRIRTSAGARTTTKDLADHLGLTQPTVSHHLGVLHDTGFLTRTREGRQTWYVIEPTAFESLQQLLDPAPAATA